MAVLGAVWLFCMLIPYYLVLVRMICASDLVLTLTLLTGSQRNCLMLCLYAQLTVRGDAVPPPTAQVSKLYVL